MSSHAEFREFLYSQLCDRGCGFSIGGLGALAEFHDPEAELSPGTDAHVCARSARGAIRIDLGQDKHAIDAADRDAVLFDLGAGMPHIDYCVRTADAALIETLRRYLGEQVVSKTHPLMDTIVDASPHRVVFSKLARIEVYQRIDRHVTPTGPHTHLLPDLLKGRRSHSANIPIPSGQLPLLNIHPENPLHDAVGQPRAFDQAAFARFELLLQAFGDPIYVAEKKRMRAALKRQLPAGEYIAASSRVGRLAQRIVLRQANFTPIDKTYLRTWQTRFEN
jgi:hypothetical protein